MASPRRPTGKTEVMKRRASHDALSAPKASPADRPDPATAKLLQVLAEELEDVRNELASLRDEMAVIRAKLAQRGRDGGSYSVVEDGR